MHKLLNGLTDLRCGGGAVRTAFMIAGYSGLSGIPASAEPTMKYETPASLTATIYEKASTNVLFRFKRTATSSGTNLSVLVEYNYPDGRIAARENLIYERDRLTSFSLDDLQSGAKGAAKLLRDSSNTSGRIEFTYLAANSKREKASEAFTSDTLTSDMIGDFLSDHWADLMNGQEINFRYLVIPRRQTIGFALAKMSETTWQGKPSVVIRMKPSSWAVGLMIEPLVFVVEKKGAHRVLQYTGRTTPRIKSGNGWKDLDAVTVFDWN